MFADRGLSLRLLATLALVAGLAFLAARRGSEIQPAAWRCLAFPERWDGTELWLGGTAGPSRPDGFVFRTGEVEVEVRGGPPPVREGEAMELTGVFRAEPAGIELREARAVRWGPGGRRLLQAVSLGILVLVGINFARRFSIRPQALQAEEAEDGWPTS